MASITMSPATLGGHLRTRLQTYFKRYLTGGKISSTQSHIFLAPPMPTPLCAHRIYFQAKISSAHYQIRHFTKITSRKSFFKHHAHCKRVLNERHQNSQFRIDEFVKHSARPKREGEIDQKAVTRSFYEDSDQYLTADNFLQSHHCPESTNDTDIEDILAEVSYDKEDVNPEMLAKTLSLLARQPKKRITQFLQSSQYDPCLTMVSDYSKEFTDQDFVAVLVSLYNFGIPPWHRIYKVFISESERRVQDWDVATMLLVSDTWRAIGRTVVRYNSEMLKLIEPQYLQLTHHQLVQLLYVIGENRTAPLTLMKKLEDMVLSYVDELTGREIAAVCLGYFKSQTIISSAGLLQVLGDRACGRLEQLDVFSVVSIFKAFRHATTVHLPLFKKAAATFSSVIRDQQLVAVMQLVFTYAALHVFDKNLLDSVAEKAVQDAKLCRIKDIAKFLWTFGQLNYRPANADMFFDTMMKEVHAHSHKFPTYPEHLVYSVAALSYLGIFPYDLINTLLSPAIVQQIQEYCPWETVRDLYVVDGTVGVECEDYTGHRLSQDFIKHLPKGAEGSVKHELAHRENLAEVVRVLEQMVGRDHCRVCLILPHFKSADIEVHLDQTNQAMVIGGSNFTPRGKNKQVDIRLNNSLIDILTGTKTEITSGNEEETENKNTEIRTRLAIQVTSFKHHHYNGHTLLGVHEMKRRQLRKLGYQVVEIPYYEWQQLPRHPNKDRMEYLTKKIFGDSK